MKSHRSGVTLIEALMAIFVTAIGLLSLLVLFPVGAFRMAQAITDDRAGHVVINAFSLAEARSLHSDPALGTYPNDQFTNPAAVNVLNTLPNLTSFADPVFAGPSYPVYIDPIGSTTNGPFVSFKGAAGPGIPRSSVSFVQVPDSSLPNSGAAARYWFSLLDDLAFQTDTPFAGQVVSPLTRDGIFTVAYMLRRPRYQFGAVADAAVVVYKNRPAIGGGEDAFQVTFDVNTPEVAISYAGTAPSIRKGSWILDATMLNTTTNQPEPHGYFYRVVNVSDNNSGTMTIELQNTPKQGTPGNYGVLVVMENVIEVFEKGPGWKP